MISKGVPGEFLQFLEEEAEGDKEGLCDFIRVINHYDVSYDILKYMSEKIEDCIYYTEIIEYLIENGNDITKEKIDLFTEILNKYSDISRRYRDSNHHEVYCAKRLFRDICKNRPMELCALEIEYPRLYYYIDKYYTKGLDVESMKTVLENIKTNNKVTDVEASFKRACNKLLKQTNNS